MPKLSPPQRAAIARAFALLDSVAFVTQPGDTERPLSGLRAVLAADDALTVWPKNSPAPDWRAIATENARALIAAREERDEARDALAAAECERDAARRERDAIAAIAYRNAMRRARV